MRVISGQFKGHKLFTPKDQWIRPTTDRTREFLFSYLNDKINQAHVLDLFAGTGSFGIEALSRHAASVVFVDQSNVACELVQKNLDKVRAQAKVYRKNAKAFLLQEHAIQQQYDIVFCDPPYRFEYKQKLLQLILDQNVLTPEGLVIYESDAKEDVPVPDGMIVIKEKKMGTTKITVLKKDD